MTAVYLLYCDQPFNVSSTGSGEVLTTCSGMRKQIAVEREVLIPTQSDALPALDRVDVAAVFGAAFSIVLLFFLVGRGVGSVLNLIRKG